MGQYVLPVQRKYAYTYEHNILVDLTQNNRVMNNIVT